MEQTCPQEIWTVIFMYLELQTLYLVNRTCKTFRAISRELITSRLYPEIKKEYPELLQLKQGSKEFKTLYEAAVQSRVPFYASVLDRSSDQSWSNHCVVRQISFQKKGFEVNIIPGTKVMQWIYADGATSPRYWNQLSEVEKTLLQQIVKRDNEREFRIDDFPIDTHQKRAFEKKYEKLNKRPRIDVNTMESCVYIQKNVVVHGDELATYPTMYPTCIYGKTSLLFEYNLEALNHLLFCISQDITLRSEFQCDCGLYHENHLLKSPLDKLKHQ